jgi:hypothetical protein
MDQASTSAAFTNDKVRVGTVLAAAMIAKAAMSIATAGAINLMGEGCKLKGVDAIEPPDKSSRPGPALRGPLSLGVPCPVRESNSMGRVFNFAQTALSHWRHDQCR